MKTITVKRDEVNWDDQYYPRTLCNWQTVERYKDLKASGAEFPPIVVAQHPKTGALQGVDGRHRWEMGGKRGEETIDAEIIDLPPKEWLAEALRRNMEHGRQLSLHERLNVAHRLMENGYSQKKAALAIGVPTARLRTWFDRGSITDATGKQQALKASMRAVKGTSAEGKVLALQHHQAQSDWRLTARQFLDLMRAGVVDAREDADLLVAVKTALDGVLSKV
jgi:hypothetical protein